jgi:hypothetical protein
METIAIYWEPKIKTYGIAERIGLSMVSFEILSETLISGEDRLRRAGSAAGELLLVFGRPSTQGGVRLHLLFEGCPSWHLLEEFSGVTGGGRSSGLQVDADVDLLYFQGPHFGDRYGVADAAFGALLGAEVTVLAAACTGASIYIVLTKGSAQAAHKALSEAFVVPGQ